MYSYWQAPIFFQFDHVIIGAGLVGCSVAYFLKQHFPQAKVLLIDSSPFPNGASVRNAGILTFGTPSEWEMDLQSMHLNSLLQLIQWRYEGMRLLLDALPPEAYDYKPVSSYDLYQAKVDAESLLEKWNHYLEPLFSSKILHLVSAPFPTFPYALTHSREGQLHSGKLLYTFYRYLAMQGCYFLLGTQYIAHECLSTESKKILIATTQATYELQSENLFFCTNAYTSLWDKEISLIPGRGQIILLRLRPSLEIEGNYHYDRGFYYFRQLNSYILFGGGRHLFLESEKTLEHETTEQLKLHLIEQAQCLFPNYSLECVHHWAGIMAFGDSKMPIMEQKQPGVYYLVRMGGMGVSLAMKAADELISRFLL